MALLGMIGFAGLWLVLPGVFAITTLATGARLFWIWGIPLGRGGGSDLSVCQGLDSGGTLANAACMGSVFLGAAAFTLPVVLDPELGEGILDLGLVTPELVAFYELILLILLGSAIAFLPLSIGWSVMRRQLFNRNHIGVGRYRAGLDYRRGNEPALDSGVAAAPNPTG